MIRCIAIDDDGQALEILESHIAKIPFLELLHTFDNAFNAIDFIDKERVDLVFTGVEMAALNGLDFLGSLRRKPYTVIVSKHRHYAVEAFQLDAVDYLLKPVSFERFLRAVTKVRELIRIKETAHTPFPLNDARRDDCIFIKSDYKTIRIDAQDILFIEGLKDYVKVYTPDKSILSLLSLRVLEQNLSPERFMRVHRSYIVALNKIDIIEKSRIRIGQHSIAISDMYRDAFLKKIHPLK
jgi:DNA-binding LytR/AlgR family response regulator